MGNFQRLRKHSRPMQKIEHEVPFWSALERAYDVEAARELFDTAEINNELVVLSSGPELVSELFAA